MSVLIKDMEKPKSCYAIIDGEFEYCPFVNTDDDCVLLLKKGICEGTWEEQYSKCPLVETPEPCEDTVSRKDVQSIAERSDWFESSDSFNDFMWALYELPSVTPKAKTGKWVIKKGVLHPLEIDGICSKCGYTTGFYNFFNFCPNCGAKMNGGEQE